MPSKNPLIKYHGEDAPLTEEEATNFIRYRDDPIAFFTEQCYVRGANGRTLFSARDYQLDMINDILDDDNRHMVILAPRQSGKTVISALLLLHKIVFFPDCHNVFSSYRISNVKDVLERVKYTMEELPDYLKPPITSMNTQLITTAYNSAIAFQLISSSLGRGSTVSSSSMTSKNSWGCIIADEFAYVKSEEVKEQALQSSIPSLEAGGSSSRSKLIIISTPNSSADVFANTYHNARQVGSKRQNHNGFTAIKVDHTRIEGRDEEWKKEQIRRFGLTKYLIEFECKFLGDKPTLVNTRTIESMESLEPLLETDDMRWFRDDISGRSVAIALDPSEGLGRDSTCIQLFDLESLEQIAEWENNDKNQNDVVKELIKIIKTLNTKGVGDIYLGIERNGVGAGIIALIRASENPIWDDIQIMHELDSQGNLTNKMGFYMGKVTKDKACATFKSLVECDKMKINSSYLIDQLKFFIKTKQGKWCAEAGFKDDLVMGCIIFMVMLEQLVNYEESLESVVYHVDEDDISGEVFGII
jgi:hypothetical protein